MVSVEFWDKNGFPYFPAGSWETEIEMQTPGKEAPISQQWQSAHLWLVESTPWKTHHKGAHTQEGYFSREI